MSKHKLRFRDVSSGLKKLRDFLLGRKYTLHGRFPPMLAPRTIPPPDIPRGPDHKYSKQYYFTRNALDSVKPPVVAPIAEGSPLAKGTETTNNLSNDKVKNVCFECAPTPGPSWWWDGHCYYDCTSDYRKTAQSSNSSCTVAPPCGLDQNPTETCEASPKCK